ncbi:MAG TPA: carbonic anhydrase [Candidatus Dormibacteraeota bacterium]
MSSVDAVVSNSRSAFLDNSTTPAPPRLQLAVLTCMDARIDVFKLLGLHPGDAHVLRNAGGRATEDVVRSLAISQALLGTREVMVIHHTDCGLSKLPDSDVTDQVAQMAGSRPTFEPLTIDDEAAAVRADLEHLRQSPYLHPGTSARGFIYDIAAGRLDEVT